MAVVDVSEIIENQKLSRFLIGLVAISWIITFFDGLDANLISFAASYFRKDYHLTTARPAISSPCIRSARCSADLFSPTSRIGSAGAPP